MKTYSHALKAVWLSMGLITQLLPASAQETPFLSKEQVQELASGKAWNSVRFSDGHKVKFTMRANGLLFGNNYTSNFNDSGSWSVNELGQFCMEWRGSRSGCYAISANKATGKWQLHPSTRLNVPGSEFTVD